MHQQEKLPAPQRHTHRTLVLAALGGALEMYDFVVFIYFANVFSTLFFPATLPEWLRQLQLLMIFGVGYMGRPLGGVIMAHFGDLRGRKRLFSCSVFLMAFSTLGIAILPSYQTLGLAAPLLLLLLRLMQGIGIGGEVPGAWVFIAEHARPNRIGLSLGLLTAGLNVGILLGSAVAVVLTRAFTPDALLAYGWRFAFLAGGLLGIITVYLRRYLEETPVFTEMRVRRALSQEMPLKTVLKKCRPAVRLTASLTAQLSVSIVVIILLTPTYLQNWSGVPETLALQANFWAVGASIVGCCFFGYCIDRLGPATTLFLGNLGIGVSVFVLYRIAEVGVNPTALQMSYAAAGFFAGLVGAIPFVIVQVFPPAVRFSGLSFSYNVTYAVFAGLTPAVLQLGLLRSPAMPAYYVIFFTLLGSLTAYRLKNFNPAHFSAI